MSAISGLRYVLLLQIDTALRNYPSRVINLVTLGPPGASLCARAYLYREYHGGRLASVFVRLVDLVEPGHCLTAARIWRARVRLGFRVPDRYARFFKRCDLYD